MHTPHERGVSLVEVMVAMVVLGLISAGIMRIASNSLTAQSRASIIQELDVIHRKFRDFVDRPFLLQNTLTANAPLNACVQTPSAATCNSVFTEINLMHPIQSGTRLAGPRTSPVHYSLGGQACDPSPTSTCAPDQFPMSAYAGYTATTAGIRLYFCLVRRVPAHQKLDLFTGTTADSNSCLPFAVPGKAVLRPNNRQYNPATTLISLGAMRACPAGQVISGFGPDMSPICTFTTQLGATCPAGQFSAGVKADGSPDCRGMSVSGGSCPNGVVGIDSGGGAACAPPGKTLATVFNCPPETYAAGLNADGVLVCLPLPPLKYINYRARWNTSYPVGSKLAVTYQWKTDPASPDVYTKREGDILHVYCPTGYRVMSCNCNSSGENDCWSNNQYCMGRVSWGENFRFNGVCVQE